MSPTAEQILADMVARYAACRTYADEGDVVSVMNPGELTQRTQSRPFVTRFDRESDRFLFQFRERTVGPESEWRRYVIWSRNGKARMWWSLRPQVEEMELQMAIAGATGVSGASAYRIPTLLLFHDRARERFHSGEMLGEEEVDGRACWKIADVGRASETVLIDQADLVIRRVEHDRTITQQSRQEMASRARESIERLRGQVSDDKIRRMTESFERTQRSTADVRSVSTTTYTPGIDEPVDAAEFQFDPP